MIDKKFLAVDNHENNFLKYAPIKSELLWGEKRVGPVLISIVIITYKRAELVKQAIKSACNQEKVKFTWEIVIVDNNPDEEELYCFIEKLNDNKIRYYRNEKNIGHEGNVNRGIELAAGKWAALLHDDDLLTPDYLVLMEQYIWACRKWKNPLAYIRAKHLQFSEESEQSGYEGRRKIEPGLFIKRELWIETLLRGFGPTYVNSCGSLVNRKAFLEIGGYNDKLNPIADATLGLIFMKHGYSIYATELVLGFYRQGKNLSIKKETMLNFIEADYFLREYLFARNRMTQLFGKLFREAQYSESVDRRIQYSEKYHEGDLTDILSIQDVEEIHHYKKSKVARVILKMVRRCFVLVYRQSHIIWREK